MKSGNNLIGKTVTIKCKDSIYNGEWGVIKHFDGEFFHIALWNDEDSMLIFYRSEFKVSRK